MKLVSCLLLGQLLTVFGRTCQWKVRGTAPEVYWINMDKSVERRMSMQALYDQIGLRNRRVSGLTPKKIYIPDDIASTWQTAWCMLETAFVAPPRDQINETSPLFHHQVVMDSLCGRGKKKNTPKELGCTVSHLFAMYEAIYSTSSRSKYALITEDDVSYPFDIDFDALAASAPSDFGILQLFNSNEASMKSTWQTYVRTKQLWVLRNPKKFMDFWSTCAYLIDKEAMKPVIDAVVRRSSDGWLHMKVVAGINNPCVPRGCCPAGTDDFQLKPPCVWAPRGYQADSFLYAMTRTYMLTVPLISNGKGGNQSTFHQDHVESVHRNAFRQQREFINLMLTGEVAAPAFASPACGVVDVSEI